MSLTHIIGMPASAKEAGGSSETGGTERDPEEASGGNSIQLGDNLKWVIGQSSTKVAVTAASTCAALATMTLY